MSVINDMLRNVARRGEHASGGRAHVPKVERPLVRHLRQLLNALALSLVIVVVALLAWQYIPNPWKPMAVRMPKPLGTEQLQRLTPPTIKRAETPATINRQPLTQLLKGELAVDAGRTRLILEFSAPTRYMLTSDDEEHGFRLRIPRAEATRPLPTVEPRHQPLLELGQHQLDELLQFEGTVAPGTRISDFAWQNGADAPFQIVLDLSIPGVESTPPPVSEGEEPSEPTGEEMQMVQRTQVSGPAEGLREARQLVDQGRAKEADALLRRLLTSHPRHAELRGELIDLLLRQGRISEASRELDAALLTAPENRVFVQRKARILVDQGALTSALALLRHKLPPLTEALEDHAFVAALEQRLGHHEVASGLYRQVLANDPTRGTWWLGLAISLQALGESGMAQDAFRNALRDPRLPSAARVFADEQTRLTQG